MRIDLNLAKLRPCSVSFSRTIWRMEKEERRYLLLSRHFRHNILHSLPTTDLHRPTRTHAPTTDAYHTTDEISSYRIRWSPPHFLGRHRIISLPIKSATLSTSSSSSSSWSFISNAFHWGRLSRYCTSHRIIKVDAFELKSRYNGIWIQRATRRLHTRRIFCSNDIYSLIIYSILLFDDAHSRHPIDHPFYSKQRRCSPMQVSQA